MKKYLAMLMAICMLFSLTAIAFADDAKWSEEVTADGWIKVTNEGGKILGYSPNSGVQLLEVDGYAFKDLDKDGELDIYEDWRLDAATRAADLASQMSGEEIAPLLTHGGWGTFGDTYPADDEYVLAGGRGGVTRQGGSAGNGSNVAKHTTWSNSLQALCESLDYGIPAVISIDPNGMSNMIDDQALAATMDPELAFEVGKAYSEQWRAMGISMLLGPQIDLQGSPAMSRGNCTYGEDPALDRDITEAFVSGLQSTFDADGNDLGWGKDSVAAAMKHFAGAGASEGGRDDHSEAARFTVFPNNNFEAHLIAFYDGAFNLKHSSTGSAAGVMTNYSVLYSEDGSLGELMAGAYSKYKFDLLKQGGYDGFIISDWGVWDDWDGSVSGMRGRGSWGTEDWTTEERLAYSYQLGMCQAGGFNNIDAVLEAWELLCDDLDEDEALEIFQARATTILTMYMNLDLFENPYRSVDEAVAKAYSAEALAYGLETQLHSVVMLKNDGTITDRTADGEKLTVYIPYVYTAGSQNFRGYTPSSYAPGFDLDIAAKYFNVVTDTLGEMTGKTPEDKPEYAEEDVIRATAEEIAECDFVLAKMIAPYTGGAASGDGNGIDDDAPVFTPASLQYSEYTADTAKDPSIGVKRIIEVYFDGYNELKEEHIQNRSYKGNTAALPSSYSDYTMFQQVLEAAQGKKIVVAMTSKSGGGSMVWTEIEPYADAILWAYANNENFDEALLMTAAGLAEPEGLLVVQMPASMEAVEAQADDLVRDTECYVDANGNTYDFAFGMSWSGVIDDERVATYSVEPLTECENFDFFYAN